MNRRFALLAAAAFLSACTPKAEGICESDSACAADERCSAGICLKKSLHDSDGGTDGGVTTAIAIQKPAANDYVSSRVNVSAKVNLAAAPDSVAFELQDAAHLSLGSASGTAGPDQTWSGSIDVNNKATGGPVTLVATMFAGGSKYLDSVQLTLDQIPPTISTTWDGTQWKARSGSFTVIANAGDNSGVKSALLSVLLGASSQTFNGTIDPNLATFAVPANLLAVAGQVVKRPFTLTVTDLAGNSISVSTSASNVPLVLMIDDQPPYVAAAADSIWHNSHAPVTATASDGSGSGVDAGSVRLVGGTGAAVAPTLDGGAYLFDVDVHSRVPGTFEGPLLLQVLAGDAVGNLGDAGVTLLVDVVPPGISQAGPQAAPDQASGSWYSAHGADLAVQAVLDGGAGSPLDAGSAALAFGGRSVAGVLGASNVAVFSLPRDAGAGLEGALALTVSAADLAGNAATAPLSINFDDVPPSVTSAALADGGKWAARVQSDGGVAAAVKVVAVDLGSGVASVWLLSDAGTTLSGAVTSAAGGAYSTSLDLHGVAPGSAGAYPFVVAAQDGLANASSTPASVNIDDSPPSISQPIADVDTGWHSGLAGSATAGVTPIITIDDNGSGVSASPAVALPDGGGIAATAARIDGSATHGRWQFASITVPDAGTLSGSYGFPVSAADAVGNSSGAASIGINIDNVPPSFGTPAVAKDNGSAYVRGSNAQPGDTLTFDVAATLVEDNLGVAPTATFAAAGSPVTGTFNNGDMKWHFAIPRTLGAGGGIKTVTLNAVDKAGNASSTSAEVNFDDTPIAFTVNTDNSWYGRAAGADIKVTATLANLPPSGVASATLAGGTCSSPGDSLTGKTINFSISSTCAPPNKEAAFSFFVTIKSGAGATSSIGLSRFIDDVAPVISVSNPSSVLIEGTSATVATFTAHDCGAGINTAAVSLTIDGNPAASLSGPTSQPDFNCGLSSAKQWSWQAVVDFTQKPWLYKSATQTPNVTMTVSDGALTAHSNSATAAPTLARLRWTSPSIDPNIFSVVVGSRYLFTGDGSGVHAVDRLTGNKTLVTSVASGLPLIVGSSPEPTVFWMPLGTDLNSAPESTLQPGSTCIVQQTNPNHVTDSISMILEDAGHVVGQLAWHSTNQFTCNILDKSCPFGDPLHCSVNGKSGCNVPLTGADRRRLGPDGCVAGDSLGKLGPGGVLGRTAYFTHDGTNLTATHFNAGGVFTSASSANNIFVTDNGAGSDTVFGDDATRRDFTGSGWGGVLVFQGMSAPLVAAPSRNFVVGWTGANWELRDYAANSKNVIATSSVSVPPLIDADGTVYLVINGNTLRAVKGDATGFGTTLLNDIAFQASINRIIIGRPLDSTSSSTLYVSSGGKIFAYAIDTYQGLGTKAGEPNELGWPAPNRDACGSQNLGFPCPY